MRNSSLVFPLHVLVSFIMTGIIIFTQFVHYPLFEYVDPHRFHSFYNTHFLASVRVLSVLMVIELVTALLLFYQKKSGPWVFNFLLVLGTWILTGFVQGPLHTALLSSYDLNAIHKTIQTNYFRVALWSAHCGIVFWQLLLYFKKLNTQQKK